MRSHGVGSNRSDRAGQGFLSGGGATGDIFEPMVVRFRDPNDPGSVEGVSLGRIGELFPGVEWARMDVEVTDAPVTEGRVAEHLPWLNDHSKMAPSAKSDAHCTKSGGRDRPSRADRPLVFFMRAYILVLDWERH